MSRVVLAYFDPLSVQTLAWDSTDNDQRRLSKVRMGISLTRRKTAVVLFASLLIVVSELVAQAPPAAKQEKGMTASLEFGGSYDSSGAVYELASSLGYAFSGHFAMGLGVRFISPSRPAAANPIPFTRSEIPPSDCNSNSRTPS